MSPPLTPHTVSPNTILNTVQQVAQSLTIAAQAIDTVANSEPVKLLVRARILSTVKARLPWVVVPLVGAGLAYWGVRAWQRRPNASAAHPHDDTPRQAHPA